MCRLYIAYIRVLVVLVKSMIFHSCLFTSVSRQNQIVFVSAQLNFLYSTFLFQGSKNMTELLDKPKLSVL